MTILLRLLLFSLLAQPLSASPSDVRIGEIEQVYTFSGGPGYMRGVAFDSVSPRAPRLFVLDGFRSVDIYRPVDGDEEDHGEMQPLQSRELPGLPPRPEPARVTWASERADPRGLAYALEGDRDVLWFLIQTAPRDGAVPQLVRFPLDDSPSRVIDLSLHPYRIGNREVFDVAVDGNELLVSFDASGYDDRELRVQRGIVRLAWNPEGEGQLEFIRHHPDSGESPARGLAVMELGGARYLWATADSGHIYAAEASTGRGLFFFERPRSSKQGSRIWGLAFGDGALWVLEDPDGLNHILRVNVTRNLDAPLAGAKILRHLTMTIESKPEEQGFEEPGHVYHCYSRPYDQHQIGRQGVWTETERLIDVSEVESAEIEIVTQDPAGDLSSRQYLPMVEYGPAPARTYASRYEIDFWMGEYRKCVYPHLVDTDRSALTGSGWLADDPDLYGLSDRKTYVEFFERVEAHIQRKYGVSANLSNPYWAARNAVEYIQDSYYYPIREKGVPAAVDYDRRHYDANPGNLKIELSGRPYDRTQIIACSGTSVMVAGAMRHLGIPGRWLGTGTQEGSGKWDENGNGLLDRSESAPCTNGHRYSQVWLGSHYGWVCFDATPTKPDHGDFDPPPPLKSQWRYMERAAGGHRKARRIVFNVGSELIRPLYRDFEYDERLAVDNNCGGDQRYNLQGRFESPEHWKLARHRIAVTNSCFVTDLTPAGPPEATTVTWKLDGPWERDPDARVSLFLERVDEKGRAHEIGQLTRGVPATAGSCVVDLSAHRGKRLRLVLRKDGDRETGGVSEIFER